MLNIGLDIPAPERVISDEMGVGIIIPVAQSAGGRILRIDWDDVRDPESRRTRCASTRFSMPADGGNLSERRFTNSFAARYRTAIASSSDTSTTSRLRRRPADGRDVRERLVVVAGEHVAGTGRKWFWFT